jgi:glycosyltransferase involved in cell wall biosynthesis
MKSLAIITSHPIQYNAPLFELLSKRGRIRLKVFYTWGQTEQKVEDPAFGHVRSWDIPLLQGYEYAFVKNTSKQPGSHHFRGIINPTLIQEVSDWNPDVILIYGWAFSSHLKLMRHFKGKKRILFRGDSTMLNSKAGIKSILRKLFLRWVYSHVDVGLYVGLNNKKYFLETGLRESQLVFAPHAVDNDRFKDEHKEYTRLAKFNRSSNNIADNCIVFLYAGKFQTIKNLDTLVITFKSIRNQEIRLVLVGNGPEEQRLRALAEEDRRILFLGFKNQSEMPWVYRMADIYVLSSRSETWGLSVNEAMASSRGVLISRQCGCAADLVEEGVTGYLFDYDNKEELAEKLLKVTDDKELLTRMGASAAEKIGTWNFENIAKAIEAEVE